jgi:hypothetical protein
VGSTAHRKHVQQLTDLLRYRQRRLAIEFISLRLGEATAKLGLAVVYAPLGRRVLQLDLGEQSPEDIEDTRRSQRRGHRATL